MERLDAMEQKLVGAGFHPLSDWWRRTLRRFFESGRRTLVCRVGRRGGKGVTMARVAVLLALHGTFQLPPGEVGMFAFLSVTHKEAQERLRNIAAVLRALGEPYTPRLGDIELERRPIIFRVLTASIAGVSGPTCIGAVCDEMAKWHDDRAGANPATEVLASLRPTMATQPGARLFLVSSPLGQLDAHAAAYALGDTAGQTTSYAPTWVANPTLTEDQTHELEPNEDIWKREYAAIPLEGSEESLFLPALIDMAERKNSDDLPYEHGCRYNAAMDPALVRNAWTLAVCAMRWVYDPAPRLKKSVVAVRQWRGTQSKPLRARRVLGEVAQVLRQYHLRTVDTDEFHGQSLQEIATEPEIDMLVRVLPTTAEQKLERYEQMLARLSDSGLELPKDRDVRADLLGVKRVLTPRGFTIRLVETPDGRHCDYASSISLGLQYCRLQPDALQNTAPPGHPAYYERQKQQVIDAMERSWKRRQEEAAG